VIQFSARFKPDEPIINEGFAVIAISFVMFGLMFFWRENAMSKLAFALLGSAFAICAFAQDSAVKMTREELQSFLPGTKVTHVNQGGSERHWTNVPDGTLFATTNNKIFGNGTGSAVGGHYGTWKVSDEGKYCLDIDWKDVHEKWCSSILKGEGDTYYLGKVDEKRKIVFAK
jgi:hypothetical protein